MREPFDSRQLRAFVTLAETGSFTLTAKKLSLSQSAVSHSIKALEEDTACRLLDRVGKKALLTQAGEQLLHHARKVLQQMAEARETLERLGKWGQSRLRLGASSTACEHLLPRIVREFKQKHPHCSLLIEPGDTPHITELLHTNRIDLGLALEPKGSTHFEFHPLFTDELSFLVDLSHPWAAAGQANRREIPGQHYILYSKSSYTFRLVEDYFHREKMALNTVIELGNMNAVKELVKLGLGITIAAPWIAKHEINEGSLCILPLGIRKVKRSWGVVHRKGRRLSLAEETFIRVCRDATAELLTCS